MFQAPRSEKPHTKRWLAGIREGISELLTGRCIGRRTCRVIGGRWLMSSKTEQSEEYRARSNNCPHLAPTAVISSSLGGGRSRKKSSVGKLVKQKLRSPRTRGEMKPLAPVKPKCKWGRLAPCAQSSFIIDFEITSTWSVWHRVTSEAQRHCFIWCKGEF